MIVSYPPFYPQQILDADGKPVAGGRILSFYAGTDVPLAMFAPDGTSLGSSVSIASDGTAVFCLKVGTPYKLVCVDADGATIWTRDKVKISAGDGMVNPMEAPGDLIVGGPDGDPLRLAPGADGDILATASGAPTWEGGPKKYRNVYHNIPWPDIDDGYLGCLFYLSGSAQALTLPATANIPFKSFIDFVFLDGTATLTITPQGTTTLNAQAAAVTIGGQAATLYRLTFLGHGGSGDEWALGGSVLPDGKIKVDGSDPSPGYLLDKLYPGDGIAIEAFLDGAVRKVKVSATGGGGGGGSDWSVVDTPCNRYAIGSNWAVGRIFYPLGPSVRSIGVCISNFKVNATAAGTAFIAKIPLSNGNDMWAWKATAWTKIATKSFSQPCKGPFVWVDFDADVDVSDKTAIYFMAIGFSSQIVSGENIGFRLSAALASNGMSDGCEFNMGYNGMNNATKVNDINSTANAGLKFCLGVSSAAQNS